MNATKDKAALFESLSALETTSMDLSPKLNEEALRFLLTRRSTPAKILAGPGPSDEELALMLLAAARTPDHGKLAPWRFIVLRRQVLASLADDIQSRGEALGLEDHLIAKEKDAFLNAPLIVTVVYAPKEHPKVPASEQHLSAGAVCLALVNAALALGYGANWLTGWSAHDADFTQNALELSASEAVAGYIHLGAPKIAPPERPRPDLSALVTELKR